MGASDHLSEWQFHGTTPEAAEAISREGFSVGEGTRHGQSAGKGIYLHPNARVAAQHGPVTVATVLDERAEIHPNPYADRDVHAEVRRLSKERGGDTSEHISEAVSRLGYHGHKDPDDGSTVVYNPKHVHYLVHYRPDEV